MEINEVNDISNWQYNHMKQKSISSHSEHSTHTYEYVLTGIYSKDNKNCKEILNLT